MSKGLDFGNIMRALGSLSQDRLARIADEANRLTNGAEPSQVEADKALQERMSLLEKENQRLRTEGTKAIKDMGQKFEEQLKEATDKADAAMHAYYLEKYEAFKAKANAHISQLQSLVTAWDNATRNLANIQAAVVLKEMPPELLIKQGEELAELTAVLEAYYKEKDIEPDPHLVELQKTIAACAENDQERISQIAKGQRVFADLSKWVESINVISQAELTEKYTPQATKERQQLKQRAKEALQLAAAERPTWKQWGRIKEHYISANKTTYQAGLMVDDDRTVYTYLADISPSTLSEMMKDVPL